MSVSAAQVVYIIQIGLVQTRSGMSIPVLAFNNLTFDLVYRCLYCFSQIPSYLGCY